MSESGYHFVVGAYDYEMERIVMHLRRNRLPFAHALIGGRRVNMDNAYSADGWARPSWLRYERPPCFVECDVPNIEPAFRIDHHHPGDPGFGRPPEEFFEASSIGQFLALTGLTPTKADYLTAAADHCLRDAYAGRCPGIDRDELLAFRIEAKAKRRKVSPHTILGQIDSARSYLASTITTVIGGEEIADLRGIGTIPDLPEASAYYGLPWIADTGGRADRKKLVIQSGRRSTIETFILDFGPRAGLVDIYGDPDRGYAGGYFPNV